MTELFPQLAGSSGHLTANVHENYSLPTTLHAVRQIASPIGQELWFRIHNS